MPSTISLAEQFSATEGDDVIINGVHVWHAEWRSTDQHAAITHYGSPQTAPVYEAEKHGACARFAATEVSNGVYVFGVPREQP